MKNVITINPDEFLAQSNGRFFFIIYTNAQGSYFGFPGGGLQSVEHALPGSPAIQRDVLSRSYYSILSAVKSNPHLPDGRLDVVELPSFEQ